MIGVVAEAAHAGADAAAAASVAADAAGDSVGDSFDTITDFTSGDVIALQGASGYRLVEVIYATVNSIGEV
ncbi:MAG: hypothetical protein HY985_05995, partial [Magnetospirillum sp.]|nr:hypothetical protein [Magnetospirillum sp.]